MARHELRCKIKIRLPVDGKRPRDVTDRTNEIDKAVQALKDALHESNVEVTEPEIVQVRAAPMTLDIPPKP